MAETRLTCTLTLGEVHLGQARSWSDREAVSYVGEGSVSEAARVLLLEAALLTIRQLHTRTGEILDELGLPREP